MSESRTRISTRLISMLLVLCMVFGMVPAGALPVFAAEQTVTEQNVQILLDYAEGLLESDYSKTTNTGSKYSWDTGEGKDYTWLYYNGIMLDAFMMNGASASLNLDALDFVASFYNANIQGTGRDDAYIARFGESNTAKVTYDSKDYNLLLKGELDSIAPARAMFDLLGTTKDQDKYEGAIQVMYSALLNGNHFKEVSGTGGNVYHKTYNSSWDDYPVAMDGIYMAQPFFMECAKAINAGTLTLYKEDGTTKVTVAEIEEAVYNRMMWVANNMDFTSTDGATLYHHGVNASGNGRADVVWLRGAGWYAAALTDVIEMMTDSTYKTNLIAKLKIFLDGMLVYQDKTDGIVDSGNNTGMWYNVVYPAYSDSDNRLETSGTALMAYALMKAYNNGWMGAVTSDEAKVYGQAGLNAFNGIMSTNYVDGKVQNVYITAGVESSAANYCTKGYAAGEGKGMGPLLMATSVALDVESKLGGGSEITESVTITDLTDTTIQVNLNEAVDYSDVVLTTVTNKGNVTNYTHDKLTFSNVDTSTIGEKTSTVSYSGVEYGTVTVEVIDPEETIVAGDVKVVEKTANTAGDVYNRVSYSGLEDILGKEVVLGFKDGRNTLALNGTSGITTNQLDSITASGDEYTLNLSSDAAALTLWYITEAENGYYIYAKIGSDFYYLNGKNLTSANDQNSATEWSIGQDAGDSNALNAYYLSGSTYNSLAGASGSFSIKQGSSVSTNAEAQFYIYSKASSGETTYTDTLWARLNARKYTVSAGSDLSTLITSVQNDCYVQTATNAAFSSNVKTVDWSKVKLNTDVLDLNIPNVYNMPVTYSSESMGDVELGTLQVTVKAVSTDPYITVSPSSLALVVGGESKTLTATIHNDNGCSVTWFAADNDATVRVENGVCAPVAAGDTKVFAQLWSSEGELLQTVEVKVSVTEPAPDVVDFTLNKTSLVLYAGDSAQLSLSDVTVNGESVGTSGYTIGLVSDKTSVATVSGTTVSAAAGGEATITVQLYKDGVAVSGATKEVAVTVDAAPTITITNASASQATEVEEGKTLNLATSINAAGDYTLAWESSDSAIASVDQNGVVTGVKAGGPVTITATLTTKARATVQATALITVTEALAEDQTATGNVTTSTTIPGSTTNHEGSNDLEGWVTISSGNSGGGSGTTYIRHTGDIVSGEQYIIVDVYGTSTKWYAMGNGGSSSAAAPSKVGVTISDDGNTLTFASGTNVDSFLWTFTGSDESFTVVNGTNYIKPISNNKYIYSGTAETLTVKTNSGKTDYQIFLTSSVTVNCENSDGTFKRGDSSDTVRLYKVVTGGSSTPAEYAQLDGSKIYEITPTTYANEAALLEDIQENYTIYTNSSASTDGQSKVEWTDENVEYTWSPDLDLAAAGKYVLTVTYKDKILGTITVAVNTTTEDTTEETQYNATLTVTPGELALTTEESSYTGFQSEVTAVLLDSNGNATSTAGVVSDVVVTWSVKSGSAVSVNATTGEVTILDGGDAVITATLTSLKVDGKDGTINETISVDIPVTVTKVDTTDYVYTVDGASSDKTALDVDGTANVTVDITAEPETQITETDITWVSSNSSIASVDANGKVTAKAPGKVTITATVNTVNGEAPSGTNTASVEITVNAPVVSIETDETMALNTGFTGTINKTAVNSSGTAKVTWAVTEGDAVSVDANGKVTALKAGTATVTATVTVSYAGIDETWTATDTTVVTVTDPTVTLTADDLAITTGKTGSLVATATVDGATVVIKEIEWTTEDAALVISGSTVTGTNEGTGNITATVTATVTKVTVNGVEMACDLTANATVTVKPAGSLPTEGWVSVGGGSNGSPYKLVDSLTENVPYLYVKSGGFGTKTNRVSLSGTGTVVGETYNLSAGSDFFHWYWEPDNTTDAANDGYFYTYGENGTKEYISYTGKDSGKDIAFGENKTLFTYTVSGGVFTVSGVYDSATRYLSAESGGMQHKGSKASIYIYQQMSAEEAYLDGSTSYTLNIADYSTKDAIEAMIQANNTVYIAKDGDYANAEAQDWADLTLVWDKTFDSNDADAVYTISVKYGTTVVGTITVTMEGTAAPVVSFDVAEKDGVSLNVGGEQTLTPAISVTVGGASTQYTNAVISWATADGTKVTVTDGTVKGIANTGTGTVSVTATLESIKVGGETLTLGGSDYTVTVPVKVVEPVSYALVNNAVSVGVGATITADTFADVKVKITYSDGTTEEVTTGLSFNEAEYSAIDTSKGGTTQVTTYYNGTALDDKVTVNVIESHGTIETQGDVTYTLAKTFDPSKQYLIVAQGSNGWIALKNVDANGTGGTPVNLPVTIADNTIVITAADAKLSEWTFKETGSNSFTVNSVTYKEYTVSNNGCYINKDSTALNLSGSSRGIYVYDVTESEDTGKFILFSDKSTDDGGKGKHYYLDGNSWKYNNSSRVVLSTITDYLYLYEKTTSSTETITKQIVFGAEVDKTQIPVKGTAAGSTTVLLDGEQIDTSRYAVTWAPAEGSEDIVSVAADGTITGKAAGTATVTVTLTEVDGATANAASTGSLTRTFTIQVLDQKVTYKLAGQPIYVRLNGEVSFAGITLEKTSVYVDAEGNEIEGTAVVETISNSHLEFDPALVDLDTSVPDADPNTAGIQPYQVPVYYNGTTLDEKVLVYVSASPYYGLESTTNYPVFPEAGAVRLEKDATTVEGKDFQKTGVAKIELSVAGISNKSNIDVVMIVDVSNSMEWSTGTQTIPSSGADKLDEAMAIAQDFADILLGSTNNQNTISFVTFAGNDNDNGGDTERLDSVKTIFTGLGADKLELIKSSFAATKFTAEDALSLGTLNSDQTKLDVTSGTNRGGTNYDYAFGQAADAVQAVKDKWEAANEGKTYAESGREVHVIFMTDGAPNRYNNASFNGVSKMNIWGKSTTGYTDMKYGSSDYDKWTTFIQKYNDLATSLYAQVDGFYAVGFDLANGGFSNSDPKYNYTATLDELREVLEGLVKNERLQVELANDTDELKEFYTSLAEALVMAGTDAKADDTLGSAFTLFTGTQGSTETQSCPSDITVGAYELYTRAELAADGEITDEDAKKIGTHKLDAEGNEIFTPLMKVSFENGLPKFYVWNAETKAYVVDATAGSYTVDDSGKINMIDTEYFTYTLDASGTEKIEWHIGNITDDEIVINYYAYLTGSHDDPIWRDSGVYVTNEVASIQYVDINGAYSVRVFEQPSMAWGEASVTFRFYLVNEDGQYVNWAGEIFDAKANRLFLQNTAMESIEQEELATYTIADIYAMAGLDAIYQLYCSGDTEVAIKNSFSDSAVADTDYYGRVTYAEGDPAVTKQLVEIESINGDQYVQTVVEIPIIAPKHGAETSGRPMVADEVVLDYYQSVIIDVLSIERDRAGVSSFGTFDISVVGFHAYYEGHNEKWMISKDDITRNTRLVTDYGIFELIETGVHAGKVKFTPAKALTSPVRVFCEIFTQQTTDKNGNAVEAGTYDNYLYNQLTIYPASNVYYEAESFPGLSYSSDWTKDESDSFTQDDGMVGKDNTYGYDSHYTGFSQDSANGVLYVNGQGVDSATKKFKTYARFSFTGSGLDIIGRTGPEQGMIRVTVYTDEAMTNAYKTVTVLNKGETDLYQIPVVELRDLSVDTYYVEIGVYNAWKPAGSALASLSRGGEFYLDAIRVYDPAGADAEYALATAAYYADGEADPIYMDIRDTLIGAGSFDASSDSAVTEGSLYLDTDRTESGKYTVDEYKEIGPNNEVYLLPGNAIAFKVQLKDVNVPASLDIGAKAIAAGHAPDLKITVRSASGEICAYTVSEIATATDMYYSVAAPGTAVSSLFTVTDSSPYGEAIVVIQNADTSGSDVLSITDLKIAYGNAAVSDVAQVMIVSDMDTVIAANDTLNGDAVDYSIHDASFDDSEATVLDLTTMTVVTSNDVSSLVVTDSEGSQVWSTAIYLETISGERIWTVTVRPTLLGEQTFTVTGYGADGTAGASASANIYVGY